VQAQIYVKRGIQMRSNPAKKLKQIPTGYLVMGADPCKKKTAAVNVTQDFTSHSRLKFNNSKEGFKIALGRREKCSAGSHQR
jgi:hypothetical protein